MAKPGGQPVTSNTQHVLPFLVEQGKEEIDFIDLITTGLVYLDLRPEWGV
jgi:hypothetical protein